jgi:hypothetical protein
MARKVQDQGNKELELILQSLLDEDMDITAREVARRHSALSSASTITRQSTRRQLVEHYQMKQRDMRVWQERLRKRSKGQTAELVSTQEANISKLDQSVRVLVAGHISLIAAVAQVGGMGKLAKFYERFREIRDQLSDLNALPDSVDATGAIPIRDNSDSR